jgi:hypothetical protein
MFSRWTFVRQKTIERALQGGRLDEAFERLVAIAGGASGGIERLITEAATALRARARVHTQAGRYPEALADLERVRALGREDSDSRALRERVEAEQRARQARHATDNEAFQRAAAQVQAGRLDSGRAAVERIGDADRRERLREELDIRAHRSSELLEQAQQALERQDVLSACRLWEEAATRHGRTRATDDFAGRLTPAYRALLQDALRAGRLEAFRGTLAATASLRRFSPDLAEFDQIAALLEHAARQLGQMEPAGLRNTLIRLDGLCGAPQWVKTALRATEAVTAAHHDLLACPLGRITPALENPPGIGTPEAPQIVENEGAAGHSTAQPSKPLLLLVDGGGSALLLSGERVRIGRAGAAEVDVPIAADLHSRHAEVVFNGEDYYLVAHGPTRVNQRSVSRALLRDGDRIVLGGAAKMVFERPSVKTDTAALRLSDRNRLAQDVGRVVLFRGACSIGAQPSCHVRTREGGTRVTLFERDHKLYVRRATPEGRPDGPAKPAPLDATVEMGDARLTLKEYA